MLAHKSSVRGIAVEGNYMATTGLDRRLRAHMRGGMLCKFIYSN
uniref:Uncharacterized protein n=1 Tax=Parascaris equorum TaxID=6256 RepID=A0A914RTB2_PAREQ